MSEVILHASILAFGLIMPLGAQNIFVFNQGAVQPRLFKALPAVITAAICDTILIGLAVFGASLQIFQWPWVKYPLYAAGCLFLLYMAWTIWHTKQGNRQQGAVLRAGKQIGYAMSVSLLNPHAIMDTVGVIGTSSLQYEGFERLVFAVTTVAISWLWFIGLACAGRMVGNLDASGKISWYINRLSAIMICAVALYVAYQLIVELR